MGSIQQSIHLTVFIFFNLYACVVWCVLSIEVGIHLNPPFPFFAFILFVLGKKRPDSSFYFILYCCCCLFFFHIRLSTTLPQSYICLICKLIPIYTIVFARISFLGSSCLALIFFWFHSNVSSCRSVPLLVVQSKFYVVPVWRSTNSTHIHMLFVLHT